ncbi:MAG TPA: 3'-5' exonuclease, partial [Chitinispirillaceae bacterium]|nr:3'-5' exonuclease [Chitinispirillaceae bacterium]
MEGTIIVGHNVYFDLKFLISELRYCGINITIPHICTMSFAGFLGGKTKQSLNDACSDHGIPLVSAHCALDDTIATTYLFNNYLSRCFKSNILTFKQLKDTGKKYKFISSWKAPLQFGEIPKSLTTGIPVFRNNRKKSTVKC